ncbi:unnamed protein product [Thlaspi arvense]|uniref:Prolamin-like domain-containing protein n=1 Tax=Thlaspi arvense TaxID=13288 RepID=A0AAU9SB61_THLAR|nr:unnamed protein product [Thlaspi arvense]
MKSKQKVMFIFLTLIPALILQPSEAQSDICPYDSTYGVLDKVPGCSDAVKLVSYNDPRSLTRDCCKQVRTLPDCLLIISAERAERTTIFISICIKIFPGSIL